jgi:superfamily II DNA or RNA helicase
MFRLRPYQEEIKQKVYDAWGNGHDNVLLVMPTGLGKTYTFCSIVVDFAVTPINKEPTAIMVHRKELVQQISLTLSSVGVMHNIIAPRPTIMGIVAAQRRLYKKQFYDYMSPVTVLSVDTLNARIATHEKWAKTIRRWVTDEAAHLLKDNKWGEAVANFRGAKGLGVTATPQRLDKRGLGRHADGVFDVMVEGPSSRWGIREGFLSKYKIAIPLSDYQDHLKRANSGSDFSKEAMSQASQQSHIIGDVVINYKKFANDKQAILFATDIISAGKMNDKFNESGVPAVLLTGLSTDKERLDGMIAFREKRVKVLINVDLFDEGLDVPGIECVIMARPTMSLGKFLQMVGRGLRPIEGKEYLVLIDHVGNVARHGLPDSDRKWTLDRIVKRRDTVNFIRICSNVKCNSPYDRLLDACPWCGEPAFSGVKGGGGCRVGPKAVDGDLTLIDPDTLREMEAATQLETPESVANRVGLAAGTPAGLRAMRNQNERIETQKKLSEAIAIYAGNLKNAGFTDRQIHKRFFIEYDMTITQSLAEPKADMIRMIERLGNDGYEVRE